jgi:hypothetical protein
MMVPLLLSVELLSFAQPLSTLDDANVEMTSAPPPPGACIILVRVGDDKNQYRTSVQLLREDGSRVQKGARRVRLGLFRFVNVPEGRYKIKLKGNYPVGEGRMGGQAPFPVSDEILDCRPNQTVTAKWEIRSTEG